MSNHDKVWPTGLTEAESEEIHRNLIQGTQIFGMIAAFAHRSEEHTSELQSHVRSRMPSSA